MSILKQGHKFRVTDFDASYGKLPLGVYLLKFNNDDGFHLIQKENFKLPRKIYGNHNIVNRWLTSWKNNSEKNMGIILSGLKGSGKTITAQKLCIESNMPVIMITQNFSDLGNAFIDFLSNPKLGEYICFIDEFEKIYDNDYRNNSGDIELLQLMDGNFQTNILFLLTCNNFNINEYLINRLNRIKYRKHYSSLENDVIEEVISDLLIDKKYTQSIHDVIDNIGMCTFDLLINLIKEINLFNEDGIMCSKHLNIEPTPRYYQIYEQIGSSILTCKSKFINFQGILEDGIEIEREWMSEQESLPKSKQIKQNKQDRYPYLRLKNMDWEIEKIDGLKHFIIYNKTDRFIFKQQSIMQLTF